MSGTFFRFYFFCFEESKTAYILFCMKAFLIFSQTFRLAPTDIISELLTFENEQWILLNVVFDYSKSKQWNWNFKITELKKLKTQTFTDLFDFRFYENIQLFCWYLNSYRFSSIPLKIPYWEQKIYLFFSVQLILCSYSAVEPEI